VGGLPAHAAGSPRLKRMQRSRHGRVAESRYGGPGARTGRAKQRAFMIAALPEGDDLGELRELLRTAGAGVVGQAVQHRDDPHPNSYLGPGKLRRSRSWPSPPTRTSSRATTS